jgi:hypothetical protein
MKTIWKQMTGFFLLVVVMTGCTNLSVETTIAPTQSIPPVNSPVTAASSSLSQYAFPSSIAPAGKYMFYLHGKIIEDQGIAAVSPDFGEYEYEAILQKLASHGFVVISEQRPKNTDPMEYAVKVVSQVNTLLDAGVPAGNITIVGASKGAEISILISNQMRDASINYVLLGACHPDSIQYDKQNNITLSGNVLAIRDSVDELSGSCEELFSLSEGKGLSRYDEIVLQIGTGHGILYKPLDEWVLPAVDWAMGK